MSRPYITPAGGVVPNGQFPGIGIAAAMGGLQAKPFTARNIPSGTFTVPAQSVFIPTEWTGVFKTSATVGNRFFSFQVRNTEEHEMYECFIPALVPASKSMLIRVEFGGNAPGQIHTFTESFEGFFSELVELFLPAGVEMLEGWKILPYWFGSKEGDTVTESGVQGWMIEGVKP